MVLAIRELRKNNLQSPSPRLQSHRTFHNRPLIGRFTFLLAFFLAANYYGDDARLVLPMISSQQQQQQSLQGQTVNMTAIDNEEKSNVSCVRCDDNQAPTRWYIQMAAIPHTASSTTDRFFANAMSHAWNTSLSLTERGFVCHNKNGTIAAEKTSSQVRACHRPTLSCLFQSLRYTSKKHRNYHELFQKKLARLPGSDTYGDTIATRESRIFTALRDPAQMITSQYNSRISFDKVWDAMYNDTELSQVPMEEWAQRAWWRHNLETKMLATNNTRLIWPSNKTIQHLTPTQHESDMENGLQKKSPWLATAIQRIQSMTAFALMHRLEESFELYSFQFCVPGKVEWFQRKQKEYPISDELQAVVDQYFRLDLLLLQQAEIVFEQRMARMRSLKERGWLCDLGNLLGYPDDFSVGIACEQ